MPYPLLFDSRGLFVNPRRILMYLYKPSSYNPEVIGKEICYTGRLDYVKASINSFFLKNENIGYYKWRFSHRESYTWCLRNCLEPSFKKLIKIGVK